MNFFITAKVSKFGNKNFSDTVKVLDSTTAGSRERNGMPIEQQKGAFTISVRKFEKSFFFWERRYIKAGSFKTAQN